MANVLKMAATWLAGERKTHLASQVTYSRPDALLGTGTAGTGTVGTGTATGTAADLTAVFYATRGLTNYELVDESGMKVGAQCIDWIFTTDDFVPVFGDPQRGDRVIDENGVLYEVLDLGGMGFWRWSDTHRQSLRIHVKEVYPA